MLNWGDAQHILCEEHAGDTAISSRDVVPSIALDSSRFGAKITIIIFLVIELLVLPFWWVMFVLSTPGNGASNEYYLMVAPFAGYPLFIVIFLIYSLDLYRNQKKYVASAISISMPLVISFGYLMVVVGLRG